MIHGFIPAIAGLIVTVIIANLLVNKGVKIAEGDVVTKEEDSTKVKPSFGRAIVAPVVAILLLAINPIGNILNIELLKSFKVDSMIILPLLKHYWIDCYETNEEHHFFYNLRVK